ncbi:Hypothetical predicted protein [Lecanosticta acicola]|uniref:Nuclear GTPase SLIP-GC n=1 Tax=Lecanosticta acicola TaxID=111012 RepID=A0AAI9EF96_9PEZI|nr:Hypothetical predicted protein [Lecanosticta acicola]
MSATDAESLRDIATALLPKAAPDFKEVLAKPGRLYIAILRHNVPHQPGDTRIDADFVWIKGNQRLATALILGAYRAKCEIDDLPIALRCGDLVLNDDTKMADLPMKDQLVLLTAVNGQAEPLPAKSRTPLQSVNRQQKAPPQGSHDDRPKATPPKSKDQVPQPPVCTPRATSAIHTATGTLATKPEIDELRHRTSPVHVAQTIPASSRLEPEASVIQNPIRQDQVTKNEPQLDENGAEAQAYQPRDHDNPFAESQGEEPEQKRLEAGVAAGLKVLAEIEAPLKGLKDSADAQNWLTQIENVRKEAIKSRTVVGVVGNTGAGKSSVINAVLEEERLVPTNCMRACTAVVTEMSYNNSENPNAKYRAEIEFIKPEDWKRELRILFSEIFDDNNNFSKEISNPDSEASIAYAKIRAVYHRHTREMLQASDVDSLMKVKHVERVLGQVQKIAQRDPMAFNVRLRHYVDSKEKITEKQKTSNKTGEKKSKKIKREFEYWPLIKVVKIYTKAEALSTGAVIVDLPGVSDQNAARAAVAEGYMKQCTGLWIVAPITRAVDDKAAKTLLGDSFKRQLKYDGTYSAVTFICSKTDDISYTEAMDSLDLGEGMDELEEKLVDISNRKSPLLREMKNAKASKEDHEEVMQQVDDEIETWETLSEDLAAGKTVYRPSHKKRKRSSSSSSNTANKRRRRRAIDSDNGDEDYHEDEEDIEDEPCADNSSEPLTEADIEQKLDELKQVEKEGRREKRSIDARIRQLRDELDSLGDEEDQISAKKSSLCIAGRNEYSKSAIQQDFASGIRELDLEAAEEEDPDNFNPENDIRDYDEVARSLPVFCVSSRAYQKLSGRMQKDSEVPGFTEAEQTEIPQLRAHCKKLTVKGRQAGCRRFLNSLNGIKLTAQQRDAEKSFLSRTLKELEKALSKFPSAVQAAANDAVGTATGWGARKDEGGLLWSTYRATVKRNGVFAGASGARDFNAELTEPIYKQIATNWEKSFQRRLPHILQAFSKSVGSVLKNFHNAVEQRSRDKGHGLARVAMLGGQLEAYSAIFKDLTNVATQSLNEGQRELNREFTPFIAEIMSPTYEWCAEQRGPGVFVRMKNAVNDHVAKQREHMFQNAAAAVRKKLLKLCESIKKTMLDKADEVYVSMQRDYLTVVGVNKTSESRMPREERAIRRQIDEIVEGADSAMQQVLTTELNELKTGFEPNGRDALVAQNSTDEDMEMDLDGTDRQGADHEEL